MSGTVSDNLAMDTLRAARGTVRLIRFDPAWSRDFDLSRLGFIRSFFAQALRAVGEPHVGRPANEISMGAPLAILFTCVLARAAGEEITRDLILQTAAALAMGIVGYTLVVWIAARLIGLPDWRAYLVLVNWGDLVFAGVMTTVSSLAVFGENGAVAAQLIWLMLAAPVQILFLWRAARVTLRADVAATVLLIVLDIAMSVAADQLATVLIPT